MEISFLQIRCHRNTRHVFQQAIVYQVFSDFSILAIRCHVMNQGKIMECHVEQKE
jgi:hypothetical protein